MSFVVVDIIFLLQALFVLLLHRHFYCCRQFSFIAETLLLLQTSFCYCNCTFAVAAFGSVRPLYDPDSMQFLANGAERNLSIGLASHMRHLAKDSYLQE